MPPRSDSTPQASPPLPPPEGRRPGDDGWPAPSACLLAAIVEALDELALVLDGGLRILFANRICRQCWGVDPAASAGRVRFERVFHLPPRPQIMLKQGAGRRAPFVFTSSLQGADGTRLPVRVRMQPAVIEEGRPGWIVIAQDLTEKKDAERSRRDLEAQLVQAQKMEALGTLAAGIAHDFNNLLMTIQGNASLLGWGADRDAAVDERLAQIERAVASGANLTRQLLNFARGGTGRECAIDLNDLVDRTVDMFARTRREIVVERQADPSLAGMRGDPCQLEQVLLNLLVNAWQAMPSGGVLRLGTANCRLDPRLADALGVTPGHYARIAVSDTGVGMDSATRRRAFDPFFSTKSKGCGTGLGLSSAYGIVKKHGGTITCASRPDHGTTFTIYLPATDAAAPAAAAERHVVRTGDEVILLVDDERMVQAVAAEMLTGLGYRVHTAADAQEALEVLRQQGAAIDLIVLDLVMPAVSGLELARRLHAERPALPILFASGSDGPPELGGLPGAGRRRFLAKPFNLVELGEAVRSLLDEPSPAAHS